MTAHVTVIKVCYKQLNCTGVYSAGTGIVEINFVWPLGGAGSWTVGP